MNNPLQRILSPTGGPSDEALRRAVAGKTVLVTGASYGIGEAVARRLASAGATVLVVARSADRLHALVAGIVAQGGRAHAYPVDLADREAVAALGPALLAAHGPIDVVVANAGKSIRRSLELSYDRFHDFQRTIDVNYLGPVQLLLGLLPSMRARGQGLIVSTSTIGVRVPPGPRWGAYQASKSAFDVWLRSVAPEIRHDGVDVSTIYMSLVHTRMSAPTRMFRALPGLTPDQAAELIGRAIVERRRTIAPWWLAPAELAGAALRDPLEAALAAVYRLTADSASARGEPAPAVARRRVTDAVVALAGSGLFAPMRPDRLVRSLAALRLGVGPALAARVAAARDPDGCAIIDERGALSFAELDRGATALAAALRHRHDVGPGRAVAVMCRNHRGFVQAALAVSHTGADLLLLNTEFPGPQLRQALAQHRVAAAILDEEFGAAFDAAGFAGPRVIAWHDRPRADTIDALAAAGAPPLAPPRRPGQVVILTSGTTGTPKGAPRALTPGSLLGPLATIVAEMPLRAGTPILVGPPLFHGFGLAYLGLALVLRAPLVLRRRFDAEATLDAIQRHRVVAVVAVPLMLQRLLAVPRGGHDLSSLKVVLSGGAPLGAALSGAFMDAFGDVLYNLYGSTETGFGAIANPRDLRAAPGTVGRPPLGTRLRVLDARRVAARAGSVFIGGRLAFEGYSGGGGKEVAFGLVNSGDLGHLDAEGRLFIDGRQDDMIVSGGENVFPQEVEEVLGRHEEVADAAVIGVPDPEFGQRLRAYVVPRPGAAPSEEELREFIKRNVARYKVPRDVIFTTELPRNATGKLQRAKLNPVKEA